MRLRGLIFDLDGTLGDTLPVCYAAFREVLQQRLGRDYSDAEIRALFGPTEEGVFRRLLPDEERLAVQEYLAAYARLHPRLGRGVPEVVSLLDSLREQHVVLGVVTGKGPESTRISLRALGLAGYFEAVEAGSADGPVKPEAIRRMVRRWGFASPEVGYVGDSAYDLRAARQAGVQAIAAAWVPGTPLDALRTAQPDGLFERVSDFAAWLARGQ